nr:hypothetical protein [Tanacetum cinerariifolium]
MIENQENVKSISDKGYHAVPLPYTGNYIPPKPNLMFIDEQVKSEYVDVVSNVSSSAVKTVESKVEFVDVKNKGVYSTVETKLVKKNSFSPPIIKDWILMMKMRATHSRRSTRKKELLTVTTAKVKKVNGQKQIQALVDKQKVIITEDSIRRYLKFDDAEGTAYITNDIIFEELARMGARTTAWNKFSSTMASAIICLANNKKINFSKYIFDNMVKHLEGGVKFLMIPRFLQVFLDKQVEGMAKHKEIYVISSHNKKVFANMRRQGHGFSGNVTPLFETMMVNAQEDVGEGLGLHT